MGKIAGEIRAIIAGAVFENAAGDVNAGIFFVGEFNVRKSFVIAQQDVEARLRRFFAFPTYRIFPSPSL